MKQYLYFYSFVLFCIIRTYSQNAYSDSLIVFSDEIDKRTWEDAMTKCEAHGGRLLVANNPRAIDHIYKHLNRANGNGKF